MCPNKMNFEDRFLRILENQIVIWLDAYPPPPQKFYSFRSESSKKAFNFIAKS